MATILNSAILDSGMLHKTLPQSNSIWFKLIHSGYLMMAAILNSAIMDSAIWTNKLHSCILSQIDDGSHLEFCYLGFSHFAQKSSLVHSDSTWIHGTAILNSALLDSDTANLDSNTLLSSLRFSQKHSPSTLTLTQTNSIWLTRWWQPSWILPSWIQVCCTKLWLNLIQSDSNSFILTQLDEGSHLEICHLGFRHCHHGFRHLVIFSQILSKTLSLHSNSDSN